MIARRDGTNLDKLCTKSLKKEQVNLGACFPIFTEA